MYCLKVIKLKSYIISLIIFSILLLIVIFSEYAFNSAKIGMQLWVNNIIPALFPFLVCIELINHTNLPKLISKVFNPIMKPVFNVPGCGAFALAMGLVSGYPVGAKISNMLRLSNMCTKEEAERLLAFTNTSGPLFIIGSVGIGMLGDKKMGILLLLTHLLASISVGIIFRFYKSKTPTNVDIIPQNPTESNNFTINKYNFGSIMSKCIKNAINTLLLIGGYIIFFAVLCDILIKSGLLVFIQNSIYSLTGISSSISSSLIIGLIELTSGIKSITDLNIDFIVILPLVAFMLGLGGLSVCAQVLSIISESRLSIKPYILGKFLQGSLASLYTYLFMKYTKFFSWDIIESFSYNYNSTPTLLSSVSLLTISIITILLIIVIMRLFKLKLRI